MVIFCSNFSMRSSIEREESVELLSRLAIKEESRATLTLILSLPKLHFP